MGINDESAVIIWDEKHQTEHFIRQATLNTKSPSVGFLVPTPTTPELAVADQRIFSLAEKYLPITRNLSKALPASTNSAEITDSSEPVIIAEQDVGDYHAVTLAATDAQGLGDWLKKNDYAWPTSAIEWLTPYLKLKWKITAFKLRPSHTGEFTTNAIRMSFQTDRPFFPYSEPAEASKLGGPYRKLQVAILSDQRMEGKLADGTLWAGHLDFAGSTTLPDYIHVDKDDWLKYSGLSDKPGIQLPSHLTYFTDDSHPRPGKSDLFFFADSDQSNAP